MFGMNAQFFAEFHDENCLCRHLNVILAPQLFLLKIINGNLEEDPALLANNVVHNMQMIGLLQLQMHPTNLKILPHLMFQPIQPKMLL